MEEEEMIIGNEVQDFKCKTLNDVVTGYLYILSK